MEAPLIPSNDYAQGQMMGMLCIIRLLRTRQSVPEQMFDNLERVTIDSLSEYLSKPAEDVYLMVDSALERI